LVITECQSTTGCTFEIRPNRSLSRRGMLFFFALVSLAALSIAVRFVLLGAWMVLPFALLEVLVLGGGLYSFDKAASCRELISVSEDQLLVTREDRHGRRDWSFQPYWAQVICQPDGRMWYPSRLLIRSHGRQIEIGSCLTEEEREQLFTSLKNSLKRSQGEFANA